LPHKLSRLLEILSDGKWHEAHQLKLTLGLTDRDLWEMTEFLGKYDFAEVDETGNRVKVKKDFRKILTQTA